jgi:hypothetical protein
MCKQLKIISLCIQLQMAWNFYGVLFMPQVACSLNFINFGYCMVELYIYLVCLGESCVNFHNLSIDLVKVKFGECYSHVSKDLRKIWNLLFDTFQYGLSFMPKSAFLSIIFSVGKYTYSNAMKILW